MSSKPLKPLKLLMMGVLNVTPDSFSDGGRFFDRDSALRQAELLAGEGADIIDVGGESTRPGAPSIPLQEELDRVLPVIEAIAARVPTRVSVDTRKFEVAAEAVRRGATLVNDVGGGGDERLPGLGAQSGVEFLLMHMRGEPATMQNAPNYPRGVVAEVAEFLSVRVARFQAAGVEPARVWVDPGIGFGKNSEQNLELLRHLDAFAGIGGRLAIGTSRKSFLARYGGPDRGPGTVASNLWAREKGATVFRVHDVAPLRRALMTWEAIAGRSENVSE